MSIWSTAVEMAEATPATRNRYIDFLRALSILVVVIGHWLIAGFLFRGGEVESIQVLAAIPSTQWLTWLFQVMPIFFIVGGYSNSVSIISARRKAQSYGDWLGGRLDRLIRPLLPLIALWALVAAGLMVAGIAQPDIQTLTQMALIPIWFLAIYVMVVLFAPLTYQAWERLGFYSVAAFMLLAVVVDIAVFQFGLDWAGWSNYLWIWLGVHQLGYGWQSGKFKYTGSKTVLVAIAGWLALAALVFLGPYPLAMVGSPDPDISNTLPPKIPLLALAVAQFAIVLLLEERINRWLERVKLWAATVLINSMIMTLYLWHITVMIILVAIAWYFDGAGLALQPGTAEWWMTRPIWIGVLFLLLFPAAMLLSPMERSGRPNGWQTSNWRLITGAVAICSGIAGLAMLGISQEVSALAVVAIFAGALLSEVIGLGRRPRNAPTN
ncbi:MAG: acyltransferase [Pseudomonadota bacterium]